MFWTRIQLCGLAAIAAVCSAGAQTDVDVGLAAVATPTGFETAASLPGSVADVCIGDTYYVELWVSDAGTTNSGVSSAYVDLTWPGVQATAISVDHGTIYTTLPTGTISSGNIDELGGSVLSATGVANGDWARVAVIQLTADTAGSITYTLQPSTTGVAALGRGVIPWIDISLGTVTLTVNPLPIASAGADVTLCADAADPTVGGAPTGSGGTGPYTYAWSGTGAAFLSDPAAANPTFDVVSAGSGAYQVCVTVTDFKSCISSTDCATVTIHALPVASAGSDITVCADAANPTVGGAPTASGGLGPYTYAWTGTGAAFLSDTLAANPTFDVLMAGAGSYQVCVTVTDTNTCVSAMSCATITINALPATVVNATATPALICEGSTSTLTASVTGAVIDWYTGGCGTTFLATGNSIPVSPATSTTYYARARDPVSGCLASACGTVTVAVDYCISGSVSSSLSTPISNVAVAADLGGGSGSTDANGDYLLTVPFNWTGAVTPCKIGWLFSPVDRSFANVTTSLAGADFSGTLIYDLDPPGGGDEQVGVGDLSYFALSWQQSVPPADPLHDFDCDGAVGVADFSFFATAWLKNVFDPNISFPATCPTCGGGGPGAGGEILLELRLVAVSAPSPQESADELPRSTLGYEVGQTYFVEMWVRDLDGTGPGITSAYADIVFGAGRAAVRTAWTSQVFGMFASGAVQASAVRDLGGSALAAHIGSGGRWARVATVEVDAIAAGRVRYGLRESPIGFAAYGRGRVPWANITRAGVTVLHGRWHTPPSPPPMP